MCAAHRVFYKPEASEITGFSLEGVVMHCAFCALHRTNELHQTRCVVVTRRVFMRREVFKKIKTALPVRQIQRMPLMPADPGAADRGKKPIRPVSAA